MYQARSLIGSDASGLSDPYAQIIFCENSTKTQVYTNNIPVHLIVIITIIVHVLTYLSRFAGDRRNVESYLGRTADRQRGDTVRDEGRHQKASAHRCRGDIRSGQSGNCSVLRGKRVLTVCCCAGQIRVHRQDRGQTARKTFGRRLRQTRIPAVVGMVRRAPGHGARRRTPSHVRTVTS